MLWWLARPACIRSLGKSLQSRPLITKPRSRSWLGAHTTKYSEWRLILGSGRPTMRYLRPRKHSSAKLSRGMLLLQKLRKRSREVARMRGIQSALRCSPTSRQRQGKLTIKSNKMSKLWMFPNKNVIRANRSLRTKPARPKNIAKKCSRRKPSKSPNPPLRLSKLITLSLSNQSSHQ